MSVPGNYAQEHLNVDTRVFSSQTWSRYGVASNLSLDDILEKVEEVRVFTDLIISESGALVTDLVFAAFPDVAKHVNKVQDLADKITEARIPYVWAYKGY